MGIARFKPSPYRLAFTLRTIAVVVAMPVILLVILCATLISSHRLGERKSTQHYGSG